MAARHMRLCWSLLPVWTPLDYDTIIPLFDWYLSPPREPVPMYRYDSRARHNNYLQVDITIFSKSIHTVVRIASVRAVVVLQQLEFGSPVVASVVSTTPGKKTRRFLAAAAVSLFHNITSNTLLVQYCTVVQYCSSILCCSSTWERNGKTGRREVQTHTLTYIPDLHRRQQWWNNI